MYILQTKWQFSIPVSRAKDDSSLIGGSLKTLILSLVLVVGFKAQAVGNPHPTNDKFDLGCMNWEEVKTQYDLSQLSARDLTTLRFSHRNARRYLVNATQRFASAERMDQVETKLLICAIVDEATYGFQYDCINDQGQEMVSQELIQSCLDLRLPENTPLS